MDAGAGGAPNDYVSRRGSGKTGDDDEGVADGRIIEGGGSFLLNRGHSGARFNVVCSASDYYSREKVSVMHD